MPAAFVSVGSNIDPDANIRKALLMLAENVRLLAVSMFHRTQPVGSPGSPEFYNGVVKIDTDLTPRELKFDVLREIERSLGRERGADKYAPRTIDLDIAVYDNVVVREPDLMIPDPDTRTRPFVAVPLLELAPDMVLPDDGAALADVAAPLMPAEDMTPLREFTAALRSLL